MSCLAPITIENKNYGLEKYGLMKYKDCGQTHIKVPCGKCPACIATKQSGYIQRVQMETLNNHVFFATLTYSPEALPVHHTSSGFDIPYASYTDVINMIKRLRKNNAFTRPFRYLFVSELGTKKGRPHFHIMFFVPKHPKDDRYECFNLQNIIKEAVRKEWRRNTSKSTKKPEWLPLHQPVTHRIAGRVYTNFDCHWVDPGLTQHGVNSVAWYVMKYLMKPSDRDQRRQRAFKLNLSPEEYHDTWNTVKCRMCKSLGFGLPDDPNVVGHLRDCIQKSFRDGMMYPCYYNDSDGRSMPLSRYYKSKGHIYDFDTFLWFFERNHRDSQYTDGHLDIPDPTPEDYDKAMAKYLRQIRTINSHDMLSDAFNISDCHTSFEDIDSMKCDSSESWPTSFGIQDIMDKCWDKSFDDLPA